MAEYLIKITGVHYGANGDSVAGQKDTEEMHVRTRELLSWLDSKRPIVTLAPDPTNHIHKQAIQARAMGRRIGRVASEEVGAVWELLNGSGEPMLLAQVEEVVVREHGYVMVKVSGEGVKRAEDVSGTEVEWLDWMSELPLLPPSEQLQAECEAAYVIDNVFMPRLDDADVEELRSYLDIWLMGSRHDLSREARQKRSQYIELLEAAAEKDIRQLAEPLKLQRTRMCEREPLDETATIWWQQRLESDEMKRLWERWRLKNENHLWMGLRQIDGMMRRLPGELYQDIGRLDVILSRLYYMNTPRQAFLSILALLMLRQLTCNELGIDMRPMTEEEYGTDGLVDNPLDIPTTIRRIVDFAQTQCADIGQRQTIQLLVQWLRDDYEQSHTKEIEALSERCEANPSIMHLEFVEKKETNIDKNYGPNIEQNGGMLALPNK